MKHHAIFQLNRRRILATIFFLTISSFGMGTAFAQGLAERLGEDLARRLTFSNTFQKVVCMGELLCGSLVLPRFYSLRGFSPRWITDNGVTKQALHLVQAIREAELEGLNPQDYHLGAIESLLGKLHNPDVQNASIPVENMLELELLLTDAFFLYSSHLTAGRVNPETIHTEWTINTQKVDLVQLLHNSIDMGQILNAMETVKQQRHEYRRLKKALVTYNKITQNGGWPLIPEGPSIKKGDKGSRIAMLRSRLMISEDLRQAVGTNADFFGDALKSAVLRFQRRHGLVQDGIVGRATLSALNISSEDRFKQIKVNMERWRWLQRDFGARYLLVNIADFQLTVMDKRSIVLNMRVVVGKDYRRTPVFEGEMTYLVINPFWHIPHKLAMEDFLPLIKKNPNFANNQNIRVYESWKAGAPEIDPGLVNWRVLDKEDFSYKLVQNPGPLNALGRIKFIFPNKFSVYLHDTPARHLFNMTKRSFSSGCIRIEKPIELATYLLRNDPNWARQKIRTAIDSLEWQIVRLPEPISVQILYFTAWVDEAGMVHFRNDVYWRDKLLAEALEEKPPLQ